jgi:hypothetical protein
MPSCFFLSFFPPRSPFFPAIIFIFIYLYNCLFIYLIYFFCNADLYAGAEVLWGVPQVASCA